VVHALPAVFAVVDDDSEPVGQLHLLGHFGRNEHEVAQQLLVLLLGLGQLRNRLARDHDDVRRGLFLDVVEGDDGVVLVDEFARNLFPQDLAEYRIGPFWWRSGSFCDLRLVSFRCFRHLLAYAVHRSVEEYV